MPIEKTKGGGFKYGESGHIYYGKDAKEKAIKQAVAIKYSQAHEKGLSKPTPKMMQELSKNKK